MSPSLRRAFDRLTRKYWTEEEVDGMLGVSARACRLAHASDAEERNGAASGGAVSALILDALRRGDIEGAIVCRTVLHEGKVRAKTVLATTEEDILAARGSHYVETKFLREALPLIRKADGPVAVVGLPCDITALRRWTRRDAALDAKVAWTIALFCGHNSRTALVDGVVGRLNREASRTDLTGYRFRSGHWRGELSATYADGTELRKPFRYFSDYRNLHLFCERKCIACSDHFGYDADLSAGDVWLQRFRDRPIKETCILIRSDVGEAALEASERSGAIVCEQTPLRTALDGQARGAPLHYDVPSRVRAGRWLGISVPGDREGPAPFLKTVLAALTLIAMRFSEGPRASSVFRMPRSALRAALYLKKGLESLR